MSNASKQGESPHEDDIQLAISVINCSNCRIPSLRSYINCVSELSLGEKREIGKNLPPNPCFPLSGVLTSLNFLILYLCVWAPVR